MSERTGADVGPPMTLGAGLRRWFLQPPRPHGEVIEDRIGKVLEIHQEDPGRIHIVLIRQSVGF